MTKLIVGGFKSIRERTEIPIAPLTFLFGPNSAGKSAVLLALNTLREKLSEQKDTDYEWFRIVMLSLRGQAAHSYRHPRSSEDAEPVRHAVTLGVEIDSFPADATTGCDEGMDAPRAMALERFWTLDKADVRLEFVEATSGMQFASEITVDGKELVNFVDATTVSIQNQSATEQLDSSPAVNDRGHWRSISKYWGAVFLSLDHSFWGSSELASLLKTLVQLATDAKCEFVRKTLYLDGTTLVIRAPTRLFHVDGWGRHIDLSQLCDVLSPGTDSTQHPMVREEVLNAIPFVDSACTAVSFLVRQLRYIATRELDVFQVAGDRKILQEDDTATELDVTQTAGRGARIKDYAAWLGVVRGGRDVVAAKAMEAAEAIDDFVNDSLRLDFFAGRRYQVKPEVMHITVVGLLEREPDNDSFAERLKVNLFLEDSNGRHLDFSEVGSGVSYVMPVLVSLWGTNRSWIEQPELHLHPAAQCELGDVVIRAFNRGRFSIIETHSEHMLLRVLKRVRKTVSGSADDPELKCLPETLSVLYFEPLADGSTSIRQLRVSRGGDFMDRWPGGFFEERDRELFDE